MPKTATENQQLTTLLEHSRAFPLLLTAYQNALHQLATGKNLAMQRAITMILKRENIRDLQSVYFTEEVLNNFIETNLALPVTPALTEEYREKARQLIGNFLFFSQKEKENILPYLDTLDLPGLKKIIELYRLGHRKQSQYLQTMAEKDPKTAIKFRVIVDQDKNA